MGTTHDKRKRGIRSVSIVLFAVVIIGGTYVLTSAGVLAPTASPATTYSDLSAVYDAIASSGYDSSSLSADPDGSAFEVAKCIIQRVTGGSCP